MRMLAIVLGSQRLAVIGDGMEELVLEEPEPAVVSLAESPASLDDLIENRLHPFRTGDRGEDAAERTLLLAKVLDLASELGCVTACSCHSSR
jgi:hypothetical protein